MQHHSLARLCRTALYSVILVSITALNAACSGGSSSDSGTTEIPDDSGTANASYEGYNLFSPLNATTTYLMDNSGSILHSWASAYRPGLSVYLLPTGELLRTGTVGNSTFSAGGAGGIVQTLDWDGNVTWSFEYSDTTHLQHHDVARLPDGHILLIAWEYKSGSDAMAQGRDPGTLGDSELWPDTIIEVDPGASAGSEIVWEWHVWDHLIQDYDPTKPNYGTVADHPERINLNYTANTSADWNHINSVDYNAEHDQILLSVHNFSEIWIIDHSTTTAEAAGHSGGSYTLSAAHYGPDTTTWHYTADPATGFYAQNISGAQRLPNGNTLICEGPDGYVFEVTADGQTVWEYNAGSAMFRFERYSPDYAGFDGTSLDNE